MKRNVGLGDQLLRIIGGIVLITLFFVRTLQPPWNWVILLVAVVLILTGVFGRCPLYKLLGLNTWHFRGVEKS